MKSLFPFTLVILFFGALLFPASAAFTSLYVFGDALSSTTDNFPGPAYYGQRYSNGRVWVEVLAQRQGITYNASKNNSYYDHSSGALVNEINSFSASDATNSLFIVWVCNSDAYDAASVPANAAQWVATNIQSQVNHSNIIAKLYAKGARTLILPNAVDISKIPAFNGSFDPSYSPFVGTMRAGCIDYNTRFSNTVSQAKALYPNLKIYSPDYFTLLNNVLTNAANYGLTNVTVSGLSIDARVAFNYGFPNAATNGYGTNYIFWDNLDPTAKFHAVIADEAQKLLPQEARISKITLTNGNQCLLVVTNWPIGLNGFVDGSTNLALANWTTNLVNITSSNASTNTTTPSVPPLNASAPQWYYRVRIPYYPYGWTWP